MKNEPKVIYLNCYDKSETNPEYAIIDDDFETLDHEFVNWSADSPALSGHIKFINQNADLWIPITEGMPEEHKELLRTNLDEMDPEQTYRLLVYTDCHSMTEARRVRMAIGNKEWVWMGGFSGETITHYQLAPAKPTSDVPISLILDQIEKEN